MPISKNYTASHKVFTLCRYLYFSPCQPQLPFNLLSASIKLPEHLQRPIRCLSPDKIVTEPKNTLQDESKAESLFNWWGLKLSKKTKNTIIPFQINATQRSAMHEAMQENQRSDLSTFFLFLGINQTIDQKEVIIAAITCRQTRLESTRSVAFAKTENGPAQRTKALRPINFLYFFLASIRRLIKKRSS